MTRNSLSSFLFLASVIAWNSFSQGVHKLLLLFSWINMLRILARESVWPIILFSHPVTVTSRIVFVWCYALDSQWANFVLVLFDTVSDPVFESWHTVLVFSTFCCGAAVSACSSRWYPLNQAALGRYCLLVVSHIAFFYTEPCRSTKHPFSDLFLRSFAVVCTSLHAFVYVCRSLHEVAWVCIRPSWRIFFVLHGIATFW